MGEKNIVKHLIIVSIDYADKTLLISSCVQSGVSIVTFVTFIEKTVAMAIASDS